MFTKELKYVIHPYQDSNREDLRKFDKKPWTVLDRWIETTLESTYLNFSFYEQKYRLLPGEDKESSILHKHVEKLFSAAYYPLNNALIKTIFFALADNNYRGQSELEAIGNLFSFFWQNYREIDNKYKTFFVIEQIDFDQVHPLQHYFPEWYEWFVKLPSVCNGVSKC